MTVRQILAIVAPLVARALQLAQDPDFIRQLHEADDAMRVFVAALTPALPTKPDGSSWTDAELELVAEVILARQEALKARLALPAAGA